MLSHHTHATLIIMEWTYASTFEYFWNCFCSSFQVKFERVINGLGGQKITSLEISTWSMGIQCENWKMGAHRSKKHVFLGSKSKKCYIEWNLTRLGGPAHGIVTKTVHKTLPGNHGGPKGEWLWGYRGGGGPGVGCLFDMKLTLSV